MKARPRVLLLEDNALDVELLQVWLEDEGLPLELVNVSTKKEYERAILDGNWAAIVSDRGLPNYDGLAALQFRSTVCPQVPFFFFSGTDAGKDLDASESLPFVTAFILKSEPQRLLTEIRRVLGSEAKPL